MNAVAYLLILAALLPLLAATVAKARGERFDNNDPRGWLARQQGWRARANAAQSNLFESLPFFFAAVLYALYAGAAPGTVGWLMLAWIVLRLAYIGCYLADLGLPRSAVWALALALNIAIVFAG
ncbi:hypothetical protein FOZ76_25250 [Verticiella sediminum]|uniref:MAPEG family protein n=1 Tax=Verticiella sediminum TaxID=1247510 RepID=A0A556A7T3_9BURK|nr:MAPEG family protein [Verticiella sediminum]TSH88940.1 hypothetical protein FOZ76_25250 [Verticiella sediminum]